MRLVVLVGALALAMSAGCDAEERPATFSYIYPTIIEPNCTTIGCHNDFVATYGFQMDTLEGAYVVLRGAGCDATDVPGAAPGNFVIPGHPDRSKLIHLLEGDDVPRRMPPDLPLPQADIELVRQWILEGAPCN